MTPKKIAVLSTMPTKIPATTRFAPGPSMGPDKQERTKLGKCDEMSVNEPCWACKQCARIFVLMGAEQPRLREKNHLVE